MNTNPKCPLCGGEGWEYDFETELDENGGLIHWQKFQCVDCNHIWESVEEEPNTKDSTP